MEAELRNIKLTLAYDGGAYHGFQRQENALTVQEVLERALVRLFGGFAKFAASGRTDTGVHAYAQVVSFHTKGTIPIERVVRALNSLLPQDIVAVAAEEVPLEFHARCSARSKKYLYKIRQGEFPDPFARQYAWYLRQTLDLAAMNAGLAKICGTHDFSAFQAAGSAIRNPVRTLYLAQCCQTAAHRVEFVFCGNGFLYHMVRNLVGTAVDIGRGRRVPADMLRILLNGDRHQAGATAPAHGLYLQEVRYDDECIKPEERKDQ